MTYDNRGRGVLFGNEDKSEDRDPDYRGNLTLQDGTECWLDAWINEAKSSGKKFMSLRYKPKMAREPRADNPPARDPEFDDSIPF
jgi:uncharacterized protein (DUF736 family)